MPQAEFPALDSDIVSNPMFFRYGIEDSIMDVFAAPAAAFGTATVPRG